MFNNFIFSYKYIFFIFMVFELIIISIYIFSHGFLLKREAFKNKSNCEDFDIKCLQSRGKCNLPKHFNKTIILVIDALRYDFVVYNESLKTGGKSYQNKLKVIHNLMKSYPEKCNLLKFIADPPTTTMQRLKGLTTGSLPTFIDASNNFASAEIIEDNLIDQLVAAGKKLVILGDDTWGELYPNRFHRSFLFPSFNVMDLDTVDNGIIEHIYKEIRSPDWDVIIAHFLGVDHCGHRYGPQHPQMEVKLKQMNSVINNVTKMVKEDWLLVVIGDHGMTSTGDHGGDSYDEIETALFYFSPNLHIRHLKKSQSVSQIDLVPTLATLLGVPIPFSNLGKVIEGIEGMPSFHGNSCSYHDALYLNFQQVNKYLHMYQKSTHEFPEPVWNELNKLSINDSGNFDTKSLLQMEQFLTLARSMCEEIWAKFNIFIILLGLMCLISTMIIVINILPKYKYNAQNSKSLLYYIRHLIVVFLFVNTFYGVSILFSEKYLNILICLTLLCFCALSFEFALPYNFNYLSVLSVLFASLGSFSNSFVVSEDVVVGFILMTYISMQVIIIVSEKVKLKNKPRAQKFFSSLSFSDFVLIVCVFAMFFCIRCSRTFFKCREEQHSCDSTSLLHTPLSGLPKEFHNTRYFTSLFSLIILIVVPQKWLQGCGNLNGWEVGIIVEKTFPVLSGVFISGYWALQSVPTLPSNITKIAVYLPQVVYVISGLGILIIFYNPLLVYVLPFSNNLVETSGTPVIPQLFGKLKQAYEYRCSKSRKTPVVYGLATAISAPFLVFLCLVSLSVVIIAGDGMAPGILLLIAVGTFTSIFHSLIKWNKVNSSASLLEPSWTSVALWFLLSIHGFYATGHQPTFPTLNWASAFVGYDGTGSYIIPASLVIINTFSSQLMFGITLPLLVVVPLSVGFLWPNIKREKGQEDIGTRGEFLLVERPEEARECFISVALIYILFHSFKVFLTATAGFFLRRHLMVWKIFAPHFIFEAVGFLVTCSGVCIGLLFVFRVLSVLENWSKKLY